MNVEDFYQRVALCTPVSREEEILLAQEMKQGAEAAKERLVQGYLPCVAAYLKRTNFVSLELVYRCCAALEQAVVAFNFMQDGETFAHRLSWHLRQETTRYIADSRSGKTL